MKVGRSFRRDESVEITSDHPRCAFDSLSFVSSFLTLTCGVAQRAGLMVLTGPAGCGKTMLLQAIQDTVVRKGGLAFFRFLNPSKHLLPSKEAFEDLLGSLLTELRLNPLPSGLPNRLQALAQGLGQHIEPAVLLVDEAHRVPDGTLADLAELAAYRRGEPESLQVILAGQPELGERLQRPELDWIAKSVAVTAHLRPLAPNELARYVAHRLAIMHNPFLPTRHINSFEPAALEQLFQYSHGVPRVVNELCQRALLGRPERVDVDRIDKAAFECGLTPQPTACQVATAKAAIAQSERPDRRRRGDVQNSSVLRIGRAQPVYCATALVVAVGLGAVFVYQPHIGSDWAPSHAWAPILPDRVPSPAAQLAQIDVAPIEIASPASAHSALTADEPRVHARTEPEAAAEQQTTTERSENDATVLGDTGVLSYSNADDAKAPDTFSSVQNYPVQLEPDETGNLAQAAQAAQAQTFVVDEMAGNALDARDIIPDAPPAMPNIVSRSPTLVHGPASPPLAEINETSAQVDLDSTLPGQPHVAAESLWPAQVVEPQAPVVDAAAAQTVEPPSGAPGLLAAASSPHLPTLDPEWLMARGRAFLEHGDPASARLFFERAAAQGHAAAMTAVGRTFDPLELQQLGVVGMNGESQRALEWYRRGADAGDHASRERIARLTQWTVRRQSQR
jgi:type II secretory pathway predicted ATPase ExeA